MYHNYKRQNYATFRWLWKIVYLVLFMTSADVYGQVVVTSSSYLHAAWNDIQGGVPKHLVSGLTGPEKAIPLIEKLEFRTETKAWDLRQQEYVVRSTFISKKWRDRWMNRQAIAKNIALTEVHHFLDERLYAQYATIINWKYSHEILKLLDRQELVMRDQQNVISKLMEKNLDFDINDLLKINEKLIKNKLDRQAQNKRLTNARISGMALFTSTDTMTLDTTNWLSVETMYTRLQEVAIIANQHPKLAIQRLKINEAALDHDIELYERATIVDFAQIKYAGKPNAPFEKEWSVGVGINLNSKYRNRAKIQEAALNKTTAELDYILEEKSLHQKLQEITVAFNEHYDLYQSLGLITKTQDWQQKMQQLKSSGQLNAQQLLAFQEQITAHDIILKKKEMELCQLYIECLYHAGILSMHDRTNYLDQHEEVY